MSALDKLDPETREQWIEMTAEMKEAERLGPPLQPFEKCGCGYPKQPCLRLVLRNGPPYPPRPCEPEEATVLADGATIRLSDLLATVPPGHRTEPWTWADEERDIRSRLCLCCGQPGHHQEMIEARIAADGITEGVTIGDDGRLHDGHHRVVAAKALGIEFVPVSTRAEADGRWLRDHGSYIWELRRFGDVHAGSEWDHVQSFRQAARDFVAWEEAVNVAA